MLERIHEEGRRQWALRRAVEAFACKTALVLCAALSGPAMKGSKCMPKKAFNNADSSADIATMRTSTEKTLSRAHCSRVLWPHLGRRSLIFLLENLRSRLCVARLCPWYGVSAESWRLCYQP